MGRRDGAPVLPTATPEAHATSHTDGTDDIQDATNAQKGLATAAHITTLEGVATTYLPLAGGTLTGEVTSTNDGEGHTFSSSGRVYETAGGEMRLESNNIRLHPTVGAVVELGGDTGGTKLAVHDSGDLEVAAIDDDGNITTSGTVDGRDVAADGTKLDGIAAGAVASGAGIDTTAIHTDATSEIEGLADKAAPVAADLLVIEDSENSFIKQKAGIGNLPVGGDASGTLSAMIVAGGSTDNLIINVRNTSGTTLNPLEVVYASGWNIGNAVIEVDRADSDDPATMPAIGVVAAAIANNANGTITAFGEILNVDTSAWSAGDSLYVDDTTPGLLVNAKPVEVDDALQKVGSCSRSHPSAGVIFVSGANRSNDTPNALTHPLSCGGYDITNVGVLTQAEQAAAEAQVSGLGQWWVRNDSPQTPMFTDEDDLDRVVLTDQATVYDTIFVSAAAMIPRSTSGAEVGSVELATSKVMLDTLDFDTAADEYAGLWWTPPPGTDTGTSLDIRVLWTAASGSGTVQWAVRSNSYATDDAIDLAFGSASNTNDTFIAANDMHLSAGITHTPANWTEGEPVYFEFLRDVSADTLGVDAKMIGVEIEFARTIQVTRAAF